MLQFSMTFSDPKPQFQDHPGFSASAELRVYFLGVLICNLRKCWHRATLQP